MRILFIAAIFTVSSANAAEFVEDFQTGDELNPKGWDDCQLTGEHGFLDKGGSSRRYAVAVDESTLDKQCGKAVRDEEKNEFLHVSLIEPAEMRRLTGKCANRSDVAEAPADQMAEAPVNRSEMRLVKSLRHKITSGHWYSFEFRMSGDVERCGSQRWVIRQWKSKVSGESPFVDQRYDNGVFHVTMNSGGCRCMVAKAAGDPHASLVTRFEDLLSGRQAARALSESGVIGKCVWTSKRPNAHPNDPLGCKFDATFLRVPQPALPDPHIDRNGASMLMSYFVRSGGATGPGIGRIEVYANGEQVALVDGFIGYPYEIAAPQQMKFKIGGYRDVQGGKATIELDNVRLSQTRPPWLLRVPSD